MPAYDITGTIKIIGEQQDFSSGFFKREIVITSDDDTYPQDIKFELLKEKCDLIRGMKEGDQVKLRFDIRGREYQGKYFVNLNAFDVKPAGGDAGGRSAGSDDEPPIDHYDKVDTSGADDDEVPF